METISISRENAADVYTAFQKLQKRLVSEVKAIKRKRSWSPAQQAMAVAETMMTLERLSCFAECFALANGISGWGPPLPVNYDGALKAMRWDHPRISMHCSAIAAVSLQLNAKQ